MKKWLFCILAALILLGCDLLGIGTDDEDSGDDVYYTVTFAWEGYQVHEPVKVKEGAVLNLDTYKPTTHLEIDEFYGWFDIDGKRLVSSITVNSDLTVYAWPQYWTWVDEEQGFDKNDIELKQDGNKLTIRINKSTTEDLAWAIQFHKNYYAEGGKRYPTHLRPIPIAESVYLKLHLMIILTRIYPQMI